MPANSSSVATATLTSAAHCHFGYRDRIFKQPASEGGLAGKSVITRVRLRLTLPWLPTLGYLDLQRRMEETGIHTPTPMEIAVQGAATDPRAMRENGAGSGMAATCPSAGHASRAPIAIGNIATAFISAGRPKSKYELNKEPVPRSSTA